MSAATLIPARVRNARRVGFATWAALIVLHVIWHAWWRPPIHLPMMWALAIALVPLLLPLLALRMPARALLLIGMVALFYFCHGVSEAWTSTYARTPALLEIALTVVLISSIGAAVQRRERA